MDRLKGSFSVCLIVNQVMTGQPSARCAIGGGGALSPRRHLAERPVWLAHRTTKHSVEVCRFRNGRSFGSQTRPTATSLKRTLNAVIPKSTMADTSPSDFCLSTARLPRTLSGTSICNSPQRLTHQPHSRTHRAQGVGCSPPRNEYKGTSRFLVTVSSTKIEV
jgi:hypothetical protein